MIERIIVVIFGLILLTLVIIVKPMSKYLAFLDTHLIYHECYHKEGNTGEEYGEKFEERVSMLFWTYFILTSLLGLCLYFTQIGIMGIEAPFKWYTYFIAAGFLCYIARGIKTTPFLEEDKKGIAPKFINHLFGLALVGAFLVLIHFSLLWVSNPEEIYKLIYMPFNISFIVVDALRSIFVIFLFPLFLASVGEATLFLICIVFSKKRKGVPKKREK